MGELIAMPTSMPVFGSDDLPDGEIDLLALLIGDGSVLITPKLTTASAACSKRHGSAALSIWRFASARAERRQGVHLARRERSLRRSAEPSHRDAPAPWRVGQDGAPQAVPTSCLPAAETPSCAVPQPLVRDRRDSMGGRGRIRADRLRDRQRAACPRRRPRPAPLRHSNQASRTLGEIPRRPSARV